MKKCAIFFYAIILFFVVSCTTKPSSETITNAIQKEAESSFMKNCNFRGELIKIDLIEINQIGIFNQDKKYWPVQATITTTCKEDDLFKGERTEKHSRSEHFAIYQDDYGNWVASSVFR